MSLLTPRDRTQGITDMISSAISAAKGTADASFNAYTPPKDDDSSDSGTKPLTTQQKTNQALLGAAKKGLSGVAKTSGEGAEERKNLRQIKKAEKKLERNPDSAEAKAAAQRLKVIEDLRAKNNSAEAKKQPTLTAEQASQLKTNQRSAGVNEASKTFSKIFEDIN